MRAAGKPAALLLLVLMAGCGGEPATDRADEEPIAIPEGSAEEEPTEGEATEEETEGFLSEANQRPVLLFFPSQEGDMLVPEERIIFLTTTLTSRMKQAVSELMLGPSDEDTDAVPAFPARTRLLAVFFLRDGTAVIDLGSEVGAIPQGSAAELAAVYSLVNTVAFNFPEVRRVRLLVEGQEVPTLAGHVDVSRPLLADLTRIKWGKLGPPPRSAGTSAPRDRWVREGPARPDAGRADG